MRKSLIVILLLITTYSAKAMTPEEFDQYWIGGGLNAAGRCSTIVHPRLFVDSLGVLTAVTRAGTAGTFNAKLLAKGNTFFNSNSSGRPSISGGNTEQNECPLIIADMLLDSSKRIDNSTNRTYAAACSTCFGIMVSGQPDDPLIAGNQAKAPFECNYPSNVSLEGSGLARTSQTAYSYDFMASVSPVTGQRWANAKRRNLAIKALSTVMFSPYSQTNNQDSGGAKWQWTDFHIPCELAIYGDSADAAFNAAIKADLLTNINALENCADCWNAIDSVGVQEQYHQVRDSIRLYVCKLLKSCFPGYDSPLYHTPALTQGGKFYRFTTRPDLVARDQSSYYTGLSRGPDKFNRTGYNTLFHNSIRGDIFSDSKSWFLADSLGKNGINFGQSNAAGIQMIWCAFWHQPAKYPSASYADFEKHFWDQRWGYFGMRNRWLKPSTTNADIQVFHWPLYISGAGHLSAGSWSLNRGATPIVQPDGLYKTDLEDHFKTYYDLSPSENTIGIWQTGESFGTFTRYDNGSYPCNTHGTETQLANGGQDQSAISSGITACANPGATRPEMYVRGYGLQSCMDETYGIYYMASDLSPNYSNGKQTYVKRAFFVDADGDLIVWDQERVKSSVNYAGSFFHTPNAPKNQLGTITTLAGRSSDLQIDSDGTATDVQGGIYKIAGNTIRESASAGIKMTNGTNAGWFFPLEIRNTTAGTNGYMLAIGGPNKAGKHWRQSKYPCAQHYGASADSTSYECWIWDASGPTVGWNAVPGCYARASGCTELCADGGDTNPRYKINESNIVQAVSDDEINYRLTGGKPLQDVTPGAGMATMDWCTYMLSETPSNGDVVEQMYCALARTDAASKPTVKYARTSEILAVQIDSKIDVFPSCNSATRLTSMTFSNPAANGTYTVRVAGLAHSTTFDLYHNTGAGLTDTGTNITSSADGTAKWTHSTNNVTQFKLQIGTGGSGACCHPDGTCTEVAAASCTDTYQGDGTTCSPNPCPQPTGACCAESGDCFVSTEASCGELVGTYSGDGTNCSPNLCSQPTGACCASDGSCTITADALTCTDLGTGHTFQGYDTVCSPNPCPTEVTGACCYEGQCSVVPSALCGIAGGTYFGDAVSCQPSPCPSAPVGACCYSGQTCTVYTRAECDAISGLWLGEATVCDPIPCPPDATAPAIRGRRGSGSEPGIGPTQTIGGVR